jgi:hypothetical protein
MRVSAWTVALRESRFAGKEMITGRHETTAFNAMKDQSTGMFWKGT